MTTTEISYPHATGTTVTTVPAAFQQTITLRPDQVALRTVGGTQEITWREYAQRVRALAAGLAALARHPRIVDEVHSAIQAGNTKLSRVEQIKRFRIVDTIWEPGGDELTPKMSLRRIPISHKYAAEINRLYADPPAEGVIDAAR